MASFTLRDITYDSVTIDFVDLTRPVLNFKIVRADDPFRDPVFKFETDRLEGYEEYTVTTKLASWIRLKPRTEYEIEVRHADLNTLESGETVVGEYEFIGSEVFLTTPVLTELPLISASYPLFNWNSWPNSYSALVSGGSTSEFEKDCWNAIVNKLEALFILAKFPWQTEYTSTASATKISSVYGALEANSFNSLRHNIEWALPFGWKWADDIEFPGYVGRLDFRGTDRYGADGADDVYSTYITELVRKVNLLTEILRCDGEHIGFVRTNNSNSITDIVAVTLRKQSIRLDIDKNTYSNHSEYVRGHPSAPAHPANQIIYSDYYNVGRYGIGAAVPYSVYSMAGRYNVPGIRAKRGLVNFADSVHYAKVAYDISMSAAVVKDCCTTIYECVKTLNRVNFSQVHSIDIHPHEVSTSLYDMIGYPRIASPLYPYAESATKYQVACGFGTVTEPISISDSDESMSKVSGNKGYGSIVAIADSAVSDGIIACYVGTPSSLSIVVDVKNASKLIGHNGASVPLYICFVNGAPFEVTIHKPPSILIPISVASDTIVDTLCRKLPSEQIDITEESRTIPDCTITDSDGARISCDVQSSTTHSVTISLDIRWLYPIWEPDGSLLIRQAYETSVNDSELKII